MGLGFFECFGFSGFRVFWGLGFSGLWLGLRVFLGVSGLGGYVFRIQSSSFPFQGLGVYNRSGGLVGCGVYGLGFGVE